MERMTTMRRFNTPNPSEFTSKNEPLHEGINVFMASRCGLYHPRNEDSMLVHGEFYGVADGVGGGEMGDLASMTLLNHCVSLSTPYTLHTIRAHVIEADSVVRQTLSEHGGARGASMLSAVWLDDRGRGYMCHVGDTRIYALSKTNGRLKLSLLTLDQTYDNLSLPIPEGRIGDDPARMVGVGSVGEPPVAQITLNDGDALLLCSDGVYKFLNDERIETICNEYLIDHLHLGLNMESVSDILVNEAIDNGSHDDATAMILYYVSPQVEEPSQPEGLSVLPSPTKRIWTIWVVLAMLLSVSSILLTLYVLGEWPFDAIGTDDNRTMTGGWR